MAPSDIEEQIVEYYKTIEIDQATVEAIYQQIITAAKTVKAQSSRMAKQQRRRIEVLEGRALLKAHLARAVPPLHHLMTFAQ